ncbi:HIG1 domain family member 2A, mitochondrial-like [Babylonia areolata]|uniref:HIG1 domain family member 2A, mitochondrial-like n=1 Tax=Babylonia areolata TaxID=304850 RepID=UPI003FD0ACF4
MSGAGAAKKTMGDDDFSYLPPERDVFYKEEGVKDKFLRKTKENPFVPIGVLVTTFALSFGLWQMKTGNKRMSQNMMRLRIFGQGFTVLAVLGGVAYGAAGKSKK